MRSDSSGTSDLERMIGKAAVEAARMSSQASQAAKKILGDVTGEISETKSLDRAPLDLIDADVELIALVALPGASKDMIDLRVTEDSLYVDAKASPREGRYLRQELNSISLKREIAADGGQARAGAGNVQGQHPGVHLPNDDGNAQKVQVD